MTIDRREQGRASRRWGRRVGAVGRVALSGLVAALALAACSSNSSTSTTTTSTTTTVVSGTLPPASTSKAEIEHAYTTLFDLADPAIPPKLSVVQDGASLQAAFTKAIHSALAKEAAGATVDSVKIEQGTLCSKVFLPSPCAAVIYDILGPNHVPVLTRSAGGAVYLSNTWLVAKSTICTLLTLDNGGQTPTGC